MQPTISAKAAVAAVFLITASGVAAFDTAGTEAAAFEGRPYSPYADRVFPTEVYFGDTHVHTGLSADAGGSGTRLMPRDAYRFARGEQVTSNTGQPVKLARPYDFFMITDHSDAMGAITDIIAGAPNIMADPDGRKFHEDFNAGGDTAAQAMFRLINQFAQGKISPELNYQPGNPAFKSVWDDIVRAAEEFNDPGTFTTFIAFEWTSIPVNQNLHRNVFFRDNKGPAAPFSAFDSDRPEDLWTYLQTQRDAGLDIVGLDSGAPVGHLDQHATGGKRHPREEGEGRFSADRDLDSGLLLDLSRCDLDQRLLIDQERQQHGHDLGQGYLIPLLF